MISNNTNIYTINEIKSGVYGWMEKSNWSDFTEICEVESVEKNENIAFENGVRKENCSYDGYVVWFNNNLHEKLAFYNDAGCLGWRLWKKKPTLEQRKKTPWYGKPDDYNKWIFDEHEWIYTEQNIYQTIGVKR